MITSSADEIPAFSPKTAGCSTWLSKSNTASLTIWLLVAGG